MRLQIEQRIHDFKHPDQLDLSELAIMDLELMEITHSIIQYRSDLKKLYLNKNQISDKGAATLATQLSCLPQLEYLDLQFNQLTIDGVRDLFELKATHPILHMPLAGNPIQDHDQVLLLEQQFNKKQANFK